MEKELLYRKRNKRSLRTTYYENTGGEARWYRNSKKEKFDFDNEVTTQKMKKNKLGLDFQPLHNFILSKVGCIADEVHSEALQRMKGQELEFHRIWKYTFDGKSDSVRTDENTYYATLVIDEEGIIRKRLGAVVPTQEHNCYAGWTTSYNGKTLKPNPFYKF